MRGFSLADVADEVVSISSEDLGQQPSDPSIVERAHSAVEETGPREAAKELSLATKPPARFGALGYQGGLDRHARVIY